MNGLNTNSLNDVMEKLNKPLGAERAESLARALATIELDHPGKAHIARQALNTFSHATTLQEAMAIAYALNGGIAIGFEVRLRKEADIPRWQEIRRALQPPEEFHRESTQEAIERMEKLLLLEIGEDTSDPFAEGAKYDED